MGKMKDIPKDWKWVKLEDIAKWGSGGTPTSTNPHYYGGNIPWLIIGDLNDGIISKSEKKITQSGLENSSAKMVQPESILIAMYGSIGRLGINKIPVATNQAIAFTEKLNANIINKYLFHYLFHIRSKLHSLGKGGTQKNISQTVLKKVDLPLPPLQEQQAIVSKIEELLSELDNGKKQLQTAQQQLKVYRQSLLKWAFEGKLTNKNVKDGELPQGWRWIRMGDVCHKIQDGSHFSPQVQYNEPGENRFKYITAKNIRNDYMDFRKLIYVDKVYHDSIYSRCNPEFGDVLLTKDGINTGEVTLNTLHEPFSLLSSVCVFKTNSNELISAYLKYFIQSPYGNKAILDSMTGTAIKRIVLRKIKDAKIVLPPLKEQIQLVNELESKLTVCNKLEETINQSLQQADTLRQSILKKAFEGKLVSSYNLKGNSNE